jgi:hypothetical protein
MTKAGNRHRDDNTLGRIGESYGTPRGMAGAPTDPKHDD